MTDETTLTLHGVPVQSVFDLLGRDENDMTASLGWALRSSRPFLDAFVQATCGCSAGADLRDEGRHDGLGHAAAIYRQLASTN